MDLSQHQNLMTIFWQVLVFSRLCLPYPTLHSLKVCLCEVIFCCITDNNVIVKFTNPCHLFLKRWWPLILQLSGLFAGLLKKLLWNSKSTRISFKGHMLFTQNTAWQVLTEFSTDIKFSALRLTFNVRRKKTCKGRWHAFCELLCYYYIQGSEIFLEGLILCIYKTTAG